MPTAKKKVTTSKKPATKPVKKVVIKEVTTVTKPPVQEKPPRGYEYKTFLVKKEAKKSDRTDKMATRRSGDK